MYDFNTQPPNGMPRVERSGMPRVERSRAAIREDEVFKQQIRRRRSSNADLRDRAPISQIPATRPELLHATIGPYTLIEQIGAGSFGHVYSAT